MVTFAVLLHFDLCEHWCTHFVLCEHWCTHFVLYKHWCTHFVLCEHWCTHFVFCEHGCMYFQTERSSACVVLTITKCNLHEIKTSWHLIYHGSILMPEMASIINVRNVNWKKTILVCSFWLWSWIPWNMSTATQANHITNYEVLHSDSISYQCITFSFLCLFCILMASCISALFTLPFLLLLQFTSVTFNRVVESKHQATFEYGFIPNEAFSSRPFGLSINIHYKDQVSWHSYTDRAVTWGMLNGGCWLQW